MKQNRSGRVSLKLPPSKSTSEKYKVIPTPIFLKEASTLQKKYPDIGKDFLALAKTLKTAPTRGSDHVFKDVWKVRMVISDKGKGERGSARVIIEIKVTDKEVYVLSVYDKSKTGNLTERELRKLMQASKPVAKTKQPSKNKFRHE